MNAITLSTNAIATVNQAIDRRHALIYFVSNCLVYGMNGDYAHVDGCGEKPILLKPGAEKLAGLFQFGVGIELEERILERGEPQFVMYTYRATVRDRDGRIVAECIGSCTSEERKIRKMLEKQGATPLGAVNDISKRAQKRAYVGAILLACNASQYFASAENARVMEAIDVDAEDMESEGTDPYPKTIEVPMPGANPDDIARENLKAIAKLCGFSAQDITPIAGRLKMPTSSDRLDADQCRKLGDEILIVWGERFTQADRSTALGILREIEEQGEARAMIAQEKFEKWKAPIQGRKRPTTVKGISID